MKRMIIGLGPEYNYPGNFEVWRKFNTRYASNHGASFISRSIARQFDAEYIDDFSDIKKLNRTYDLCFVAFASHVSSRRDVSLYADVVEQLDMQVVVLSLGVQDYSSNISQISQVHPSLIRLLKAVAERSSLIGVRGYFTAGLLQSVGFDNVIPVGCPTFYWNLSPELSIQKAAPKRCLAAYHRTMAEKNIDVLRGVTILGQDFLDHSVFTSELEADEKLISVEMSEYQKYANFVEILSVIHEWGYFPKTFEQWFSNIGSHDFVFGPRLHGNIAALVQGIPAVLVVRDLRTREMARMFKMPYVSMQEYQESTLEQLFERADFSQFSSNFKIRYANYMRFLSENAVTHNLHQSSSTGEFKLTIDDISQILFHLNSSGRYQEERLSNLEEQRKRGALGGLLSKSQLKSMLRRVWRKVSRT